MDDSDRLITLAALAGPERAAAAWSEWKATNSIVDASALLTWAGGYIHRNLLATGQHDPYLAGIYRYNLLVNGARISAVLDIVTALSARWPVTPLKSFGMTNDVYSRGLRPVTDFDFFVSSEHVMDVKRFLETASYTMLLGIDDEEFMARVLPRRGSWNFTSVGERDLDLHWRVFDHLDNDTNQQLVEANSFPDQSEFGEVRRLTPEMLTVNISVHGHLQAGGLAHGMFDFYHLLRVADVEQIAALSRQVGVAREVRTLCGQIWDVVGDDVDPGVLQLMQQLLDAAESQPFPEISFRRDLIGTSDSRDAGLDAPYIRYRGLYRIWSRLGRSEWLERALSRALHGFTRKPINPTQDLVYPVGTVVLGPGWSHRYPQDECRWALWPDARLLLSVPAGATSLHMEFDREYWQAAPFQAVEVFCDGKFTGTSTKVAHSFQFPLPESVGSRRQVEVSLRPGGGARFATPGVLTSWFRLLAPVRLIEAC